MESKALSVYISRGKVIVGEDGLIDTDNPVNVLFVQDRQAKKAPVAAEEVPELIESGVAVAAVAVKPKGRVTKIKPIRERKREDNGFTEAVRSKISLESRLKEVEIEKKKRESDLLRSKQDRAAGKLVPTELVKGLFQNHFKSIVMGFKQGIDQMIIEIAKKKAMNINERAELKREMIKILNSCIDDTVKITKKDISSLVAEYSQTSASE